MNSSLIGRLALSFESTIGKVNLDVMGEEICPERRDSNALTDRICADEGTADFSADNEVGGFLKPAGNVVEVAVTLDTIEHSSHIIFLFFGLETFADKRRITDDVSQLRNRADFVPDSR